MSRTREEIEAEIANLEAHLNARCDGKCGCIGCQVTRGMVAELRSELAALTQQQEAGCPTADDLVRQFNAWTPPATSQTDDGWLSWHGGPQPVADDVMVEIRLRGGIENKGTAKFFEWEHKDCSADITVYRIVSPAPPQPARDDFDNLGDELESLGLTMIAGPVRRVSSPPQPARDVRERVKDTIFSTVRGFGWGGGVYAAQTITNALADAGLLADPAAIAGRKATAERLEHVSDLYEQRGKALAAERQRTRELQDKLKAFVCPTGVGQPYCSAGTCLECRVARAEDEATRQARKRDDAESKLSATNALVKSRGEEVERLTRERDDLASQVYVPGLWKCAKCGFQLLQSNFNVSDGNITARNEPGDKCPNCNSPLWHVTERDAHNEIGKRLEGEFDRAERLAACLREAWAVIDNIVPLELSKDKRAAHMAVLGEKEAG
jgi:rubrerythrin